MNEKTILEQFLEGKRNQRKSELTIKNYSIDLTQVLPLVFNKDIEDIEINDLSELTPLKVYDTLKELQDQYGYAPTTINRRLNSLKSLMSYFQDRYSIRNDLAGMNTFHDTREKKIDSFNLEDVGKFIEIAKEQDTQMYFILGLLFNTGMRASELLGLTFEGIHQDKLVIVGKRDKQRSIPINVVVADCLQAYLSLPSVKERSYDIKNTVLDMNYDQLRYKYTQFFKGIGIECSKLHTTRKSFATNSIADYKDVADLEVVADVMGHTTTKMLEQHYLNTSQRQQDMVNKLVPKTYKQSEKVIVVDFGRVAR